VRFKKACDAAINIKDRTYRNLGPGPVARLCKKLGLVDFWALPEYVSYTTPQLHCAPLHGLAALAELAGSAGVAALAEATGSVELDAPELQAGWLAALIGLVELAGPLPQHAVDARAGHGASRQQALRPFLLFALAP